jgi:D-arabinose 1-dehydrogenase-like Zn-dependent alcohol dehydrogenase
MKAARGSLDLILNTIPIEHDYHVYSALLAAGGKQVMLGLNSGLIAGFAVDAMTCGSSRVKGSGIGGIEATQAVIDLCAKNNIRPVVKVVPVEEVNRVYEDLDHANDSGVRYVIDIATLNEDAAARCKAAAPTTTARAIASSTAAIAAPSCQSRRLRKAFAMTIDMVM